MFSGKKGIITKINLKKMVSIKRQTGYCYLSHSLRIKTLGPFIRFCQFSGKRTSISIEFVCNYRNLIMISRKI